MKRKNLKINSKRELRVVLFFYLLNFDSIPSIWLIINKNENKEKKKKKKEKTRKKTKHQTATYIKPN